MVFLGLCAFNMIELFAGTEALRELSRLWLCDLADIIYRRIPLCYAK